MKHSKTKWLWWYAIEEGTPWKKMIMAEYGVHKFG